MCALYPLLHQLSQINSTLKQTNNNDNKSNQPKEKKKQQTKQTKKQQKQQNQPITHPNSKNKNKNPCTEKILTVWLPNGIITFVN